jgi:hypothetical protein
MPHDLNGTLLAVGDTVMVPCIITAIQPGEDYCNLSLETTEVMFPGTHKTSITANAKQVKKQKG